MSDNRVENYNAQNLLDTIIETREFLRKELEACGPSSFQSQAESRLRLAVSAVITALTPNVDTRVP